MRSPNTFVRAVIAVLVAVALMVPAALSAAPAAANTSSSWDNGCTPHMAYLVPGTWETHATADPTRPVGLLAQVGKRLTESYGSTITVLYPNYSASAFDKGQTYASSEAGGVARLRAMMARCPQSQVVLGGYSQGADVAGDGAWQIGHGQGPIPADQVAAVGLVADPKQGGAPLVGPQPGGHGIAGARPGGFGTLAGKVRQMCVPGDLYCSVNSSKNSFLAGLGKTLGSGGNGETGTPTAVAAAAGDATAANTAPTGTTPATTATATTGAATTGTAATPGTVTDGLTSDYSNTDLPGAVPMATDLKTQLTDLQSQQSTGGLTSGAQATQLASVGSMATKLLDTFTPVAQTQQWVKQTPGASKYLQSGTPDSPAGQAKSLLSTFDGMNVPAIISSASSIANSVSNAVGSAPTTAAATEGTAIAPGITDPAATQIPQGAGEGSASPTGVDALPGSPTTADSKTTTGTDPGLAGAGGVATGSSSMPDLGGLAASAANLVTQVAPLNATDTTNLNAAASILGVLKPNTIINQGLNVVSAVAGTDYQGIVANLATLPQQIFRGDITGAHATAATLNNQFRPWVTMASKIDFQTASQVVSMIPDTTGVAPIASVVLGLLGNLDIVRLARDVGQIQEVAWQVLQSGNLFALTQLLPIGLDLASVALGVLEPGAKMSPAMLGVGATPAQQSVATAAQGQDMSSMFGSLTQLVSSQGAQDLSKLVGEGLTAASFYASNTHGSYNNLVIDGKNALEWLFDFFRQALGG